MAADPTTRDTRRPAARPAAVDDPAARPTARPAAVDDPVAAVVGQLGDRNRRRVLAAVELGATTIDEIVAATGLSIADAERASARLAAAGLLVSRAGLAVDEARFHAAARHLLARPASTEHADAAPETRKVLSAFVRDGRISALPVTPRKQRIVLEWLAARVEPGHRYDEAEVNELLDGHDVDVATLRRALVDADLLDRDGGRYWRCGGEVNGTERP